MQEPRELHAPAGSAASAAEKLAWQLVGDIGGTVFVSPELPEGFHGIYALNHRQAPPIPLVALGEHAVADTAKFPRTFLAVVGMHFTLEARARLTGENDFDTSGRSARLADQWADIMLAERAVLETDRTPGGDGPTPCSLALDVALQLWQAELDAPAPEEAG